MKTLAIIWGAVLVTALGTGAYVNAAINERVAEFHIEKVSTQVNPQQTINGEKLQGSSPQLQVTHNPQQTISGEVLQPAGQLEIKTYNPQQTAPAKTLEQNVTIKVN